MIEGVKRALSDPRAAYRTLRGRSRGWWYRWRYSLRGGRVRIGRNLVAHGKLDIRGPGRVEIGEGVVIGMTVTPWTTRRNASIVVGDRTFLNGTRISCEQEVRIGSGCVMADCRILDSDFHGIDPDDRGNYRTAPVIIEDNVWLTLNSVILKGVTVGSGSTVTPNSVVVEDVPRRVLYGGNPGRVIREL